jgi:hypothetical protein
MLKIISLSTKHKAIAWIKILILTYKSWSSIRGGIRRNLSLVLTNGDIIVVSDDLEVGIGNKIPLWLFGFLY